VRATTRFETEIELPDGRYRASLAWRGPETRFGVVYFYPLDGASSDRRDRRALIEPRPGDPDPGPEELLALYDVGRPLTDTERRFQAEDGRQWLAQNRGPVWAGGSGAESGTGIVFTSLEGAMARLQVRGGHVGELSEEELLTLWREATERGTAGRGSE